MGGAILKMVSKNGKEAVSTNYTSLWEIPVTTIEGQRIERLGQLVEGKKAVLVVNVATQ